jgi:hypothetical protein
MAVTIKNINDAYVYQLYNPQDENLIKSVYISRNFGQPEDYVEYNIFDSKGVLLTTTYDVDTFRTVDPDPETNLYTTIKFDPEFDVKSEGFTTGKVQITYNVFRKLFKSGLQNLFWIKDISTDRTELKVYRNDLSNLELQQLFFEFNTLFVSKAYYQDFLLNFGDGVNLIGVNIAYVEDPIQSYLLIKLYEPLPSRFGKKDTFWVVDKISDPITFEVTSTIEEAPIGTTFVPLKGPNFNIDVNEKASQATPYFNYTELFSSPVSSSIQQLKSYLDVKGANINIDFSNYTNFVHFSSAQKRLDNFVTKLTLIESYQNDLNTLSNLTSSANHIFTTASVVTTQTLLDNIITKFDEYEYYLYFESSSYAWPKINSTAPYSLYSVSSSQGSTFYVNQSVSASTHDLTNENYLFNLLPQYIKDDSTNANVWTFVSMMGQQFDEIWLYIKAITDKYNTDNRTDYGLSSDLVADALQSFGIKLYTNTSTNDDLYSSYLGITPSGSLLPATGSELITDYVTGSNETIPSFDITSEIYKRLYHNLPYLLKSKGTEKGIRALINLYGIPDSVLSVNEYGGTDKTSTAPNLYKQRTAYPFYTSGSYNVRVPWAPLLINNTLGYNLVTPDTIEFRFKTEGVPTNYSQSLFQVGSGSAMKFGVQLSYDTTTSTGSYSDYGNLKLFMFSDSSSAVYVSSSAINLPFFDRGWWSIMIKRETGSLNNSSISNRYWVYAKNSLYDGYDGVNLGFQGSSSVYINGTTSASYNDSWINYNLNSEYVNDGYVLEEYVSQIDSFGAYLGGTGNNNVLSANNTVFEGYLQDFRYWAEPLNETTFDTHVLNPSSYVGNTYSASYTTLGFRLPLDFTYTNTIPDSQSIHPSYTGNNLPTTESFYDGDVSWSYSDTITDSFKKSEYYEVISTPNIANRNVSDKIRIQSNPLISGSTLSPFTSTVKPTFEKNPNSHVVEVAFSPSNEVDKDIINQLGYINLDNYIGDPRDNSKTSYPELISLNDFYLKKYVDRYNVQDFVRLIKYFDNSLFKLIKDFVPGRANVSTGIVVKPTILERSKVERHEPGVIPQYNSPSGSIEMETITGSNATGREYNTAYTASFVTPSGSKTYLVRNDNRELFNGDFGGTTLTVYTQSAGNIIFERNTLPSGSSEDIGNNYQLLPFQPLLNNVSGSRTTNKFTVVDYNGVSTRPTDFGYLLSWSFSGSTPTYDNSIFRAGVQDSNYTTARIINPRYLGSKTTSARYNVYTKGDTSYGQTAAIDHYPVTFAYFNEAYITGSSLPGRTNVYITYLINILSDVVELNRQNKNLNDIQNIFKSGDNVVISLTDNQNPSNQKFLDGLKKTFAGGFKYAPILYNPTAPGQPTLTYTLTSSVSYIPTSSVSIGIFPATSASNELYIGSNPLTSSNLILGDDLGIADYRYHYISSSAARLTDLLTVFINYDIDVHVTGSFVATSTKTVTEWLGNPVLTSPLSASYIFNTTLRIPATVTEYTGSLRDLVVGAVYPEPFNRGELTISGSWRYTNEPGNYEYTASYYSGSTAIPPSASAIYDVTSSVYSNPPSSASLFVPIETNLNTVLTTQVVDTPLSKGFFLRDLNNKAIMSGSLSMSYWYGGFTQANSFTSSYTGVSGSTPVSYSLSGSYELIETPFLLTPGDMIRFYDVTTNTFPRAFEREVKSITVPRTDEVVRLGRRILVELNDVIPSNACEEAVVPGTTLENARLINRFIVLKKQPDETNVVLDYQKQDGRTSSGIIIPEFIPQELRDQAGNIVKELKAQNLIT